MTHTFKLARRIARLKPVSEGPATARSSIRFVPLLRSAAHKFAAALLATLATGCTDNKLTDITSESEAAFAHRNHVARVSVTPDSLTLSIGTTGQASCKVWHRNGSEIVDRACNWGSKDTTVATVTTGTATTTIRAKKVGRAVIWAGAGAHRDTLTVSVAATPALMLRVTPDSASVETGKTVQFAATGTWSNDSSAPIAVTWTATGGTISSAGLYTAGSAAGMFRVIGSKSGIADTAPIRVTVPVSSCIGSPTTICPGDDWQAKVNAAASGTVFTIKPGVHRLQSVTPKANQQFIGEPGAVMSGARLLSGWVQSGATWYVGGQTQEFAHTAGQCLSGTSCMYPEDVYRDNVLLKRELSLAAVGPGDFYLDYAADRIYVGDNPAGHVLEGAATEYAFNGSAQGAGTGVMVRGLVIEKYANPAQTGAIGRMGTGAGWTIRENEIRYNHGAGVRGGAVVAKNHIHHNGQIGIAGGSDRADSNEIAYNNTAFFDYGWEAGGSKFVWSDGTVMRGNFVHHNRGPGIWYDAFNSNALIEGNRVEDNLADGIFWEISYGAVIRNNTVSRNGFGRTGGAEGAGILVNTSGPATGLLEISGNTLVGNKNGIVAVQVDRPQFVLKNLSVHDNTVEVLPGGKTGVDRYTGAYDPWASAANNRFERNTYNLQRADPDPFMWGATYRTDAQWRGYGNDETGTFNR